MSRAARRLHQLYDQLTIHNGVLYRQYLIPEVSKVIMQQLIPLSLRPQILQELHEGVTGGHLGMDKTLAKLKERFYWPRHYNDVKNWCHNCHSCAQRKSPSPKYRAALQSVKTGYPLQMVAMDILGPLPQSDSGNSYILVVADYFTRWTEAYAIPNQEATTIAKKLTDEFFLRFSIPEQLHSDQGRNFESTTVKELCKILHIEKTRTMYGVMYGVQFKRAPHNRLHPILPHVRTSSAYAHRHHIWVAPPRANITISIRSTP